MIYSEFDGKKLSLLGFGAMRLPVNEDGSINEALTEQMMDLAIKQGVNYIDTAYPYHGGESERVVGRILKKYPRDSFYLATKFPGHQISASYDPQAVFEEQLEKCGVDYFDFYLLHNVYENSLDTYLDPKWGIIDYFKEQKRLGRIKHLGFSSHGSVELIKSFLDICGDAMEFCQIQLNYLDWTLQNAKGKYDLLTERGIGVWVMEPVRGGKLCKLADAEEEQLKAARPEESIAAWGFRFLQGLPNVKVVLSGMSDLAQVEDNLRTFEARRALSEKERELILAAAEGMKNSVPCTACRYCCDGCPQQINIPLMLEVYNDLQVTPTFTVSMRIEGIPQESQPSACIGCGACAAVCPQGIDIPAVLKDLAEKVAAMPSWTEICRQREAACKKS